MPAVPAADSDAGGGAPGEPAPAETAAGPGPGPPQRELDHPLPRVQARSAGLHGDEVLHLLPAHSQRGRLQKVQGAAAGPSCQAEPGQVRAGEQCHNNYQRWAPYATKRKSIHALLAFFIKNFTRFSESVDGFTLLFEKNPTLKSLYCLEESFLNV